MKYGAHFFPLYCKYNKIGYFWSSSLMFNDYSTLSVSVINFSIQYFYLQGLNTYPLVTEYK